MEQGVNEEVIVNELSIQFKNLGLIDECINDVKNALVDISKAYKEEQKNIDEAYQRGFEKGKDVRIKGCEGCMYQNTTIEHNPCNLCCNAFLNRWTAKEFVRGDVVVDEYDGTRGIVVSSENNESNLLYVLFKGYRVPQSVVRKHYKKTGEHYDIDKFLDEIKGKDDK